MLLADQKVDVSCLTGQDRVLFEIAPTPIWLEDWTLVQNYCVEAKKAGISDLRSRLEGDVELLRRVVSMIKIVDVNQRAADFVGAPDRGALLGHLPGELLNESTLASLVDQVMVVWEGRSFLQVDISGVDFGGADIDCQLDWAAPIKSGRPDYSQVVVLVRDVSQHRSAERAMLRHVDQLETLLDMGRGIAATLDVDIIFELLVATAVELIGAEESLILLFDAEKQSLHKVVSHTYPEIEVASMSYEEVMDGISGLVATTREAARSEDISTDPRNKGLARERAARFPGTSVAVAPIIVDDQVIGTLTTLNNGGRPPFTDLELSLVRMLAMQAAVAIRNAELYEELRNNRDRVAAAHEELKQTQTQLLSAQKMEAIGSLASGIAHEINTPIQFVSDNASFVKEAVEVLSQLGRAHVKFLADHAAEPSLATEIEELQGLWNELDCDFYFEEIPEAIDETLEGANRVAEIVRAMKEFAHPGSQDKSSVDVNRVVETTMQVSRNEWKYVSNVELDLEPDLPIIQGHAGPLGQSLLIMLVNSAQAMADHRNVDEDGKGTIKVSTRADDGVVEIRVADNGPGIPQAIADQVFDPFFTTKDVGKGSGQGLSIARSVVVDKHQGEIWIEDADPGAVFVIRLPVNTPSQGEPDSGDE